MFKYEPNLKCMLGIKGKNFVIIASDQCAGSSTANDKKRLYKISDRILMGVIGNSVKVNKVAEYMVNKILSYNNHMHDGYQLEPGFVGYFIQRNQRRVLKKSQYQLVFEIMMGGYDILKGPELYVTDRLANKLMLSYSAQGIGVHVSIGFMNKHYKKDLNETEAYEILKLCLREVQEKMSVALTNFDVHIVNKDGIAVMPVINASALMQ